MSPFKLALLNLSRRKTPTLIAITAIAIAVACSGILLRLNILAESRFTGFGKGGDAVIGAKSGGIEIVTSALNGEGSYPGFLPMRLFETLRAEQVVRFEDGTASKPSYIRLIIPFLYFAKAGDFRIVGTDETFLQRPQEPLQFSEGQWARNKDEVVIGSVMAQKENLKIGDTVVAKAWLGDKVFASELRNLKVVGILNSTQSAWDRMAFTNLATAHEVLKKVDLTPVSIWGADVLNYFLVYLHPNGYEPLAALVNSRTVGQVVLVQKEIARLSELVGVGQNLGLFVTILVLALGGLSVTSMLITRFDAMSIQLAVLRAIGYKKNEIGRWLLWEGFLLGLAACILGLILDAVGFPFVRSLLEDSLPSADIVGSSVLQSYPIWITALCATILSVFVPLYRVYHQDVHFSLRG